MATPNTTITTPLALNQTNTCSVAMKWFVDNTEYKADYATFRPLVNGEEAFGTIYDTMLQAKTSIDIICWGFQPSMFFRRGSGDMTPIGELLVKMGNQGVKVRLLCWHDDWYLSPWSENNMPGYDWPSFVKWITPDCVYSRIPLLSHDYQTVYERMYDTWWYYRANLNNVTMVGTFGEKLSRTWTWLSHYPFTLSNIDFATRDFSVPDRGENLWRLLMHGKDTTRDSRTKIVNAVVTAVGMPSHHQKMVLIDYEDPNRATGFVMGHNMLDQYWDTDEHHYKPASSPREGRNGPHPWQDISSRVTGPILQYLNKNFCEAWDKATGQSLGKSREHVDPSKLKMRPEGKTDATVMAQLLRTQPQDGVQNIEKMYLQAVNNASKYIFIENQYLRWEPVADQIKKSIPNLVNCGRNLQRDGPVYLFVVTNSIDDAVSLGTLNTQRTLNGLGQANAMPGVRRVQQNAALDAQQKILEQKLTDDTNERSRLEGGQEEQIDPFSPGGSSSAMSSFVQNDDAIRQDQQDLDDLQKQREAINDTSKDEQNVDVPSLNVTGLKVHVCTLVAPDSPGGGWVPVYVHAKLMTVDDVFTTLGSANINSRSQEGDSELNICHEQADSTKALRLRLWEKHAGKKGADEDVQTAFSAWSDMIRNNANLQVNKQQPAAPLVGFMRTSPKVTIFD